MPSFQVLVDHPQRRILEPGVSTLVSGQDWDIAVSDIDVYVDSGTDTLMCRPGPLYSAWQTSNSGIFAKWSRTNFTTNPGPGDPPWSTVDPTVNAGDGPWFYLQDNSFAATGTHGVSGVLTASLPVNTPVVAEWFVPSQTPVDAVALECGYNSTASGAAGVSFRFYFSGRAEVWKAGVRVGDYTLSGEKKERKNRNKQAKAHAPSAEFISVMIIPCRGREVLVICSAGGSFTHVFDDIAEGTVSPVITSNSPFWWFVPEGTTVHHRFALCQFSAGGNAYSAVSKFRKDPGAAPAGGFQNWVLADTTNGTVTISPADGVGLGAYVDNANGVRVKAAIAGSGGLTPFIYGARVYTLPQTALTANSPVDVTEFLEAGSGLEMTDSNSGLTGHFTFRRTQEIEALGVANFATISHRPLKIIDDDGEAWVDGLLMPPETEVEIAFDSTGQATYDHGAETITLAVRDRMQLADEFEFYDDAPHDGDTLQHAFTVAAQQMGFDPTEIHASAFGGFTLPAAGAVTDREFNVMDKAGDRGSQSLKRLQDDFAANAFLGLDPVGGLQLTALEDAPTTEVATLYDSIATMQALGVDPDPRQLIRKLKIVIVGPEATDVYTVGMDYRTRRPVISHKRDVNASNPALAVGARPLNWVGHPMGYSFGSDQLGSQDACNWACDLMYKRLTPIRALIEIECDARAKYRRGQVLKLELLGTGLPQVLAEIAGAPGIAGHGITGSTLKGRIKSWSVSFHQLAVPDDNEHAFAPWRPGRYVLQLLDSVSDAANMHVMATSATGMREEIRSRMIHPRRHVSEAFRGVFSKEFIGQAEV